MTYVLVPVQIDRDFRLVSHNERIGNFGVVSGHKTSISDYQMRFPLERADRNVHYFIHPAISEWLRDNGVRETHCKLHWRGDNTQIQGRACGKWILSVPDHVALLFKLTWGRS